MVSRTDILPITWTEIMGSSTGCIWYIEKLRRTGPASRQSRDGMRHLSSLLPIENTSPVSAVGILGGSSMECTQF